MSSPSPSFVPAEIDPLQFLHLARDRYRALEARQVPPAPSLLPDAGQFNLAANAVLRAMATTLGPGLDPGTRNAWNSALRLIAENEPARSR